MSWPLVELGELMPGRGASVDPTKFSEEEFALFSVPAYDSQVPDRVFGKEIGSSKQVVQPGDVLLSKIVPHIRRAWIVPESDERRQIGSSEWIIFRSSKFFGPYLRHLLLSDQFNVKLMQTVSGVGGSLLRARPAGVAKLKIPLPPLEEQRRIAAILDQAEELRAQRRAAIALLDQLPQAIFLEMFGDPATNPRGLVERTLGSLCDVGSSARVFVEDLVEQGVPFYRGTEIGALGEDKAVVPTLFITHEHFAQLKLRSGTPVPGDLLLPSICPDGRIHRVLNDEPFYFKDGRVLWIKSGGSNVDPIYLRFYLKFLFATAYARIASGTTFAELKIVSLKSAPILLPHIKEQHQFAARVELARRSTAVHQSALAELDALFDSLQCSAFGVQT